MGSLLEKGLNGEGTYKRIYGILHCNVIFNGAIYIVVMCFPETYFNVKQEEKLNAMTNVW
jgi:hypothetical protein